MVKPVEQESPWNENCSGEKIVQTANLNRIVNRLEMGNILGETQPPE